MGAVGPTRLIQGVATGDTPWRCWLASLRCHELSIADWLPPTARLVIVAPHPDDEILACGGLIASHAAKGGRVLVVAVTDGEASHDGAPSCRREFLACLRRNEQWQGLRVLGLPKPEVRALALADGQVQQHEATLRQQLMSLLQAGDVVVSTWEHDGHPDHEATGRVARQVSANMGCAYLAAPVWMWHWATPGDERVPWLRLRGLPLSAPDSTQKQQALTAHRSQLAERSEALGAVLEPAILARAAWRTEYFFV